MKPSASSLIPAPFFRLPYRAHRRSSALIIVLAFLVIITGLVLTFFTRTMTDVQVSTNGANETKVDLFSQGALNAILGDLKQEIAAGSTVTNYNTTSTLTNGMVYLPATSANILPYPTGGNASALPGSLIKYSARGQPFYANSGLYSYSGTYVAPNRAVALSTTNASLNNRSITPARWNQTLLLPKATPGGTDPSPTTAFTAPDWILVTRGGGNPTAWNANLTSSPTNRTNSTTVVGRYAYAIYDEGSLLNVNVAGYPSTLTNTTYAAQRGGPAFADLTQAGLNQTQIDQIVGWRNQASIKPSGTFPNYVMTGAATNYLSYTAGNNNGFLLTTSANTNSGTSDHLFTSRQQLIQFLLQGIGNNHPGTIAQLQNAMTNLGTFSRDLNQPSYTPSTNRPTIVGTYASGGNDGSGKDFTNNPSFLSVRVTSAFTRNDGVTSAVPGEPLVKQRFALNRLAWLTYEGPSQGRSTNDIDMQELMADGISANLITQGTATNIQKYFGLVWNSAGYWTYPASLMDSAGYICTLAEVAAKGREPNFFELLKAAILSGALAKDQPLDVSDINQNHRYTSVDANIFQIGVNLIEQADTDGYPKQINFTTSGGASLSVYGVENLPYLYRVRTTVLTTAAPSVTGSTQAAMAVTNLVTGTIATPGTITALQEMEVWNPHGWNPNDLNGSLGNPRPTNFKLVAVPPTTTLRAWLYPWYGPLGSPSSVTATLTFTIQTNRPDLFREPTLLITPNIPAGSSLQGTPASTVAAYGVPSAYGATANLPSGISPSGAGTSPFLGIVLGSAPMCWINGTTGVNVPSQAYLTPSTGTVTYQLQYQNANNTYQTYDQKIGATIAGYTDPLGYVSGYAPLDAPSTYADYGPPGNGYSFPHTGGGSYQDDMIPIFNTCDTFDPRTGRFGFLSSSGTSVPTGEHPPRFIQAFGPAVRWGAPQQNITETDRPNAHSGYGDIPANTSVGPTSTFPPYSGSGWSWGTGYATGNASLRPGLFAQNQKNGANDGLSFASTVYDAEGEVAAPPAQYYADADNVVRRAMAAYLVKSGSTPASTTVGQPLATAMNYSSTGVGTPIQSTAATPVTGSAMILIENPFSTPSNIAGETSGVIQSRPIILHHPFRTVAEMGATFSDIPWKNLDFSSPESGFTGLLDVFCVQDTADPSGLVDGKINLNTRQSAVLQAVLAGGYEDAYGMNTLPSTFAAQAASLLIQRTTNSATAQGPLQNLSELVGKPLFTAKPSGVVDGSAATSYSGFASDLTTIAPDTYFQNIERFREAPIRALSSAGTVRVWNLLIDVICQTGRYPVVATKLDNFMVDGEQRYWVHVAIDRLTGQVLDTNIEVVNQ